MTTQTNYLERQPAYRAGHVPNMRQSDRITRSVEEVLGIGFGLAVGRGDTDSARGAKLAGTLEDFIGVSVLDVTQDVDNADKYARYGGISILTRGEIIVQVTGAPTTEDPVHFNATTGVFAASGGTGPVLGARWMENSDNGLGRVFLPGYAQPQS
jgi:hypothetical protein